MDASIEQRLKENAQQWMLTCPEEATKLLHLEGVSQSSPEEKSEKEAIDWFASIDLFHVETLFIYGIGLGNDYYAARAWLHGDPERHLVFLEDQLEAIHHLFQTEKGSELIHDPQVRLQYFEGVEELSKAVEVLPMYYFLAPIEIAYHRSYQKKNPQACSEVRRQLEYVKNEKAFGMIEYLSYGETFLHNIYRNLFEIPQSYSAAALFGKFKNVPAVICGAGPSLDKQIPFLKHLHERALILSGGAGVNALSRHGISPHFGVLTASAFKQFNRLFMHNAFETPYFFQGGALPEAVSLLHGERFYLRGDSEDSVTHYFEESLGISGTQLNIGDRESSVLSSLAIAHALGCNPIIFVGLDLSYPEGMSFAEGVEKHPILDYPEETTKEKAIIKLDLSGKPVETVWKWISDSLVITKFAQTHPEVTLLNSTEGGIGMEGVRSISFSDALEIYCKGTFDFEIFLHGERQKSEGLSSVREEQIVGLLKRTKEELKVCEEIFLKLQKEFEAVESSIRESQKPPEQMVNDQALELLRTLKSYAVYGNILKRFDESFIRFYGKTEKDLFEKPEGSLLNPAELSLARTILNEHRYEFLATVCHVNEENLTEVLQLANIKEMIAKVLSDEIERAKQEQTKEERESEARYEISAERLVIEDPERGLSIRHTVITNPIQGDPFHGRMVQHHASGAKKMESFYLKGQLHGPSRYYSREGTLLAERWFVEGKCVGRARFYHLNGTLFSEQSYREGVLDGVQRFYYSNGHPKSILTYKKGALDGEVTLFYAQGTKKRELHFSKGKRHGLERFWNIAGTKEFEGGYLHGKPHGIFRSWYPTGQLAREITYSQPGKVLVNRKWSAEGTLLPQENRDSLFSPRREKEQMDHTLGHILEEVDQLSQKVEGEIFEDLKNIKETLGELKEMDKMLGNASDTEALFSNSEAQKLVGKDLQLAKEKMEKELLAIEKLLQITLDQIDENDQGKGS